MDAALRLNERGIMVPTAHDLAEESGASLRTVFRLFNDMESFFGNLNVKIYEQYEPVFRAPVTGSSLEERITGCLQRRIDLFETCGPYLHSTKAQLWRFKTLSENYATLQNELDREVRR